MPSWNQIQSQLRNPQNPVVFFDVTVGRTVYNFFLNNLFYYKKLYLLIRIELVLFILYILLN